MAPFSFRFLSYQGSRAMLHGSLEERNVLRQRLALDGLAVGRQLTVCGLDGTSVAEWAHFTPFGIL